MDNFANYEYNENEDDNYIDYEYSDNTALIRHFSHDYWVCEGKPDGEEYKNSKFGRLKLKEIHWLRAKEKVESMNSHLHCDDYHTPGGDW